MEKKSCSRQISKESLELLEVLTGKIAHDYNNILTIILGNISLAKSGPDLSDETREILGDLEKATFMANEMTQHLLGFSQIRIRKIQPASLVKVVKEALEDVFEEDELKFDWITENDLKDVLMNRSLVHRAFQDIFTYLKFEHFADLPDTGPRFLLDLKNYQNNKIHYVKTVLSYPGEFIDEDTLQKLISPTFNIKKRDIGMGLITAYSIFTKHDGMFQIESSKDTGITFTILLPAVKL